MPPALQMRFHVSFTLIIWPLPHLPGKQYSLTRGRAEITSHAVGGMGRTFAPVFELGSSAFSLDSLKYSHFKVRISEQRAPVSSMTLSAAAMVGSMASCFSSLAIPSPIASNSLLSMNLRRFSSRYFSRPRTGLVPLSR